jgi:hypothetical protein
LEALSVTFKDAVRDPLALGVKVTVIVHFAPADSVLPQVVPVSLKSLALMPVIVMLVMFSVIF